jgi:PKD repeat protein
MSTRTATHSFVAPGVYNVTLKVAQPSAAGSGMEVTHVYRNKGTYDITLTVQNAMQRKTFTRRIAVAAEPARRRSAAHVRTGDDIREPRVCPPMKPVLNVLVSYFGSQSGCSPFNSYPCHPGEIIQFTAATFGYDFECAGPHEIRWDFGDGSAFVSGKQPAHAYAAYGVYDVRLTIANRARTVRLQAYVRIGGYAF